MDYLMIVSKFEPLPENFEKNIILKEVSVVKLESQTADMLAMMLKDAQESGTPLKVISGYRSADHQQMLWEKEISKEMEHGLDYHRAVAKAAKTLALPGESEHQTGLAVDFGTTDANDVDYSFASSAQAVWLDRNAHRYGFILRYPRLKEHITGIDFEPWHFRYVGAESAAIIKENGICLEEFLDYYQDKYLNSTKQGI